MEKQQVKPTGNNHISFKILKNAMERADSPCKNTAARDKKILQDIRYELSQYTAIPLTRENLRRAPTCFYRTEYTCALARFLVNLRQYDLSTALEYLIESTFLVDVYRVDKLEALLLTLEEAEKWISFREQSGRHGKHRS